MLNCGEHKIVVFLVCPFKPSPTRVPSEKHCNLPSDVIAPAANAASPEAVVSRCRGGSFAGRARACFVLFYEGVLVGDTIGFFVGPFFSKDCFTTLRLICPMVESANSRILCAPSGFLVQCCTATITSCCPVANGRKCRVVS